MRKAIHLSQHNVEDISAKCCEQVNLRYAEMSASHAPSENDQKIVTDAFVRKYEEWCRMPGNEIAMGSPLTEKQLERRAECGKRYASAAIQRDPPAGIDPLTISAIISICYYAFMALKWLFGWGDSE